MSLIERIRDGWNAFSNRDPTDQYVSDMGPSTYLRPDRPRFTRGNEKSLSTPVFNRIAMDVAAIEIKHIRTDEASRYKEDMVSELQNCLSIETNLDQTPRAFIQDIVMSMLDEGHIAIVPTHMVSRPRMGSNFDILEMRRGEIIEWYPKHVKVRVYNSDTGQKEDLILPKRVVAIVENPLYSVMNEPNSTLKRLVRKMNLLDIIDEQSGSGKLDLIIQLPYVIKTEARKNQAEARRRDIEQQLAGSKYGIAYTDGTERITQLNRAVENNLLSQIEFLTSMFYSQLGINQAVMEGTADETTMLSYNNRTIEPIASAIVDEMRRKFLSKTARTQGQNIEYFRDPFRLVAVENISEIADKFTRNEIMTSNEIRQVIGMKPSSDPTADELRNKNLSKSNEDIKQSLNTHNEEEEEV